MKKNPIILLFLQGLLILILTVTGCTDETDRETGAGKDWPIYLADNSSSHYSGLKDINKENVGQLESVWEYHTGDDVSDNRSQIQCNPIIINGVLYGTSPNLNVFALNAATGEQIWKFDPDTMSKYAENVNRGVTFWRKGSDKRILFSSGVSVYALNAETGKKIMTFGDSGRVSLREGLGARANDLYVVATTPGIAFDDLLIIGSRVSENEGAAPGYIQAFSILTGRLEWVFHTIPLPGEFGYETWPEDAWKTAGAANCWAGMSLDRKRGIVYVPTGSAAFDFWGGNRQGANLFANCILALNAKTGKRLWHFQTVHHDLWDRDLPAPPNLVTVNFKGRRIDALAQITKTGFIFLLERETGVPLFTVEEKPMPVSDLRGETSWPSQPVPSAPPPFTPQSFTREQITDISRESHNFISDSFGKIRTGNMFIPPSTQGTLIFPGFDGGGEWGGAAIDPENAVLYVNCNIMPWIMEMVDISKEKNNNPGGGELVYKIRCAVCHGEDLQGDPTGTFPSLKRTFEKFSRDEVLTIIDNGKRFMPSFKYLPGPEKDQLLAYLKDQNDIGNRSEGTKNESDNIPYSFKGYNRFIDRNGYPAIKPPWGLLSAIDLNKGKILWQVPLGEFKELTAKGIPVTGAENYGGPVVTASGIIFIAASKDGFIRAIDKDTGAELWKYKLPAAGYATPSVYEANGKQFIVIACGGGKVGTPSGDSYIAFSLGNKK